MRIRLVGILVILVFGGISMLMAKSDEPSADCQRTEEAVQPLAGVRFDMYQSLPPDIAPPRRPGEPAPDYAAMGVREVQAANDIRARTGPIESYELRTLLDEIADALEKLGKSRVNPSVPTAPSKEYFGATMAINEALHDIVKACPGILGSDEPAPVRP